MKFLDNGGEVPVEMLPLRLGVEHQNSMPDLRTTIIQLQEAGLIEFRVGANNDLFIRKKAV